MSDQTIALFSAVCKKAFIPLTNDVDELPIDNLNALQSAIDALAKRDASDYARQAQLIAEGKRLLSEQSADETGAEAEGVIQIDDNYSMEEFSEGYGAYGRGWW